MQNSHHAMQNMATLSEITDDDRYPLDPLTAEEIIATVNALRADNRLSQAARIISVTLDEPPKSSLSSYTPGELVPRRSQVVVMEPAEHALYEGRVLLDQGVVEAWNAVPGQQGSLTREECGQCERIVRADPQVLAGLERRGISDPDRVLVESWGVGNCEKPERDGQRVVWTLLFYRERPDDNPYAKPIHGLHAIVDLDDMTILRVEDLGTVPLPPGDGAYAHDRTGPHRADLRPLHITQPEGPSFTVRGSEVRWQRWSLRIGFNAREGLVLYAIGYEDQGRIRPVIYRASVAELLIPYADPRPFQAWRNAFDIGEYGIGWLTNSLERGCDCLGEIRYLDVTLCDSSGTPHTIPQAICLHEEDTGLLWKHYDSNLETTEIRRSRRLVVSFVITAGNYEYAFYWHFYQDGSIEFEVKLTGIVLTTAALPGEHNDFGTLVAQQTLAAHHQHFFSVRLDMEVEGPQNTVYEVDTEALPIGPLNPLGNAFRAIKRPLRRESEAGRTIDPLRGRYWLITNPNHTTALGHHPSYKLVPGPNVLLFADPEAPITERARYATKHLWVTPYAPGERFPAGEYPNQHPGGAGLPAWTAADRPIENTDVVVWYTLGSHHIPRPEDWPVMPVERAGFALKPAGFFDANPALDVAPPHHSLEYPS
jgi:primary-amine oxidase